MIRRKQPKTTEDKIDLILKYTRSMRRFAILRGIIAVIFLIIFIVLPIVGGVFLLKKVNLEKVSNQYFEFQETLKELKDKSSNLDEFFQNLPNEN